MDEDSIVKTLMTAFAAVATALSGVVSYLYKITRDQNTEVLKVHQGEIDDLKKHVRECDEDREAIRTELVLVQRESYETKIKLARLDPDGDGK